MIYHDPGSPAFDNIDDLLADKIVHHSRTHSDRQEKKPESGSDTSPADTGEQPSEAPPSARRYPAVLLLLFLVVVITVIYRYFRSTTIRQG